MSTPDQNQAPAASGEQLFVRNALASVERAARFQRIKQIVLSVVDFPRHLLPHGEPKGAPDVHRDRGARPDVGAGYGENSGAAQLECSSHFAGDRRTVAKVERVARPSTCGISEGRQMVQRHEAGMVPAMRPRSPLEVRARSSAASSTAPDGAHTRNVSRSTRCCCNCERRWDPSPTFWRKAGGRCGKPPSLGAAVFQDRLWTRLCVHSGGSVHRPCQIEVAHCCTIGRD